MGHPSRGFTLVEVLLVIAIIGIIAAASLPIYIGMQEKNDVDTAVMSIAQNIRRAQILSQAVDGDTNWGVHLASGAFTLFKGTSFAGRDTTVDEQTSLSPVITVSGLTDVMFTKFTGTPSATGTVTLTSPNESVTISVNGKGTVSY